MTKIAHSPVSIDAAGVTDQGRKRGHNEDQFLIATLRRSMVIENTSLPLKAERMLEGSAEGTVLMVADGMGGEGGGQVASSIAVNTIAEYVCNVMPWVVRHQTTTSTPSRTRMHTLPEIRQGLVSALEEGESSILRVAGQAGHSARMGTTLTLAYLLWPGLYVAHAGDSRCYLYRRGTLAQLTKDHTVAQQMAEHGIEVDDDSQLHHVLWNALGGGGDSKLLPEVQRFNLEPGDVILLCSDGLNKELDDDDIAAVLRDMLSGGPGRAAVADIDTTVTEGTAPKVVVRAPGSPPAYSRAADEAGAEATLDDLRVEDLAAAARAKAASAAASARIAASVDATLTEGTAPSTFAERTARRLVDLANAAGGSDNITVVVARLG
ncbi:MAG: serine/threonine-protein phosphatase [Myxococcales bacterium]|nr:serine/threonine-protein phosphatase [Myxococcales bacterium]